MADINIILKATEDCNSGCIYCDVVSKPKRLLSMPMDVLEASFIRMNEYLLSHRERRITLIWHGGEPLLLGHGYFQSAWEFQERHCRETKTRIDHCIQSNLTLLDEDFIFILGKLGINQIGTSYDPEPCVRGARKGNGYEAYNRNFMKGIALLERYGMGWGMIYVVTRKSLEKPLEVFFFLSNLKLDGGFTMNPVLIYDQERKHISITPGEYAEFLGAIFPTWWKHRDRFPGVEPFRSLTRSIMEGATKGGCVDSGNCAYNHVNIAPDGGASQCGRSSDWGLLDYGNILDRSLADILKDDQREQMARRIELLKATECKDCRFWRLCHGGCPLDAFAEHKSFMHKTEWCEAKRGFIEKHFEPVTGIRFESAMQ